jgi:hypothetical protein
MTYKKKEALLAFIESYRSPPELWDLEHPQYSNRVKKAAAYDCLIEKLKVIEPDASRESVVKKINRTIYFSSSTTAYSTCFAFFSSSRITS